MLTSLIAVLCNPICVFLKTNKTVQNFVGVFFHVFIAAILSTFSAFPSIVWNKIICESRKTIVLASSFCAIYHEKIKIYLKLAFDYKLTVQAK